MTLRHSQGAQAARTGALLVEHPNRGTLVVSGPDRASWLNGLLSCDLAALSTCPTGQHPDQSQATGLWGLALTKTGKVLSDVWLLASGQRIYLSLAPGQAPALAEFFEHHLIMEDAEMEEPSESWRWASLHGPRAPEAAAQLQGLHGSLDFTGLGGTLLVCPQAEAAACFAKLAELNYVERASAEEWAALRVERGLPEWGRDYDANQNPQEASLAHRAVSWTKGCYLGQEVVCMQNMRGKLRWQLASLALDQTLAGAVSPGQAVCIEAAEGRREVGQLKTTAWSTQLQRPVALARIKTKALAGSAQLQVEGRLAEVLAQPV